VQTPEEMHLKQVINLILKQRLAHDWDGQRSFRDMKTRCARRDSTQAQPASRARQAGDFNQRVILRPAVRGPSRSEAVRATRAKRHDPESPCVLARLGRLRSRRAGWLLPLRRGAGSSGCGESGLWCAARHLLDLEDLASAWRQRQSRDPGRVAVGQTPLPVAAVSVPWLVETESPGRREAREWMCLLLNVSVALPRSGSEALSRPPEAADCSKRPAAVVAWTRFRNGPRGAECTVDVGYGT